MADSGNTIFGNNYNGRTKNNNALTDVIDVLVINSGGENPSLSVKVHQGSAIGEGNTVTINLGGSTGSELFDASGGTISAILAAYVRLLTDNFVQPFLDNDISGTVNTNINSTTYLSTIGGLSLFAPDVNTDRSTWTGNELIANFALSSLGVVNRGLLLYLENEELQQQVLTIEQDTLNRLKPKMLTDSSIMVQVEASATIDIKYLLYVEKYGPPPGGIFDPNKLIEFIDIVPAE